MKYSATMVPRVRAMSNSRSCLLDQSGRFTLVTLPMVTGLAPGEPTKVGGLRGDPYFRRFNSRPCPLPEGCLALSGWCRAIRGGDSMSTTLQAEPVTEPVGDRLAPVCWRPIALITALVAVVVGLTNGRRGYFGDELYFVIAGRHLDWGYADQPPMAPLLAHLMDTVAPGQLWWLRFPVLLGELTAIWLAALIAREMGGGGRAQWMTAAAYAITAIGRAHLLSTNALDIPLWTAITLLLVRWVRTRRDMNLFWAGVLTAVSLQVKFLIPGFWLMLGISVLLFGPRRMLGRPALWLGAAVAIAAWVPGLIWQASHGWPQIAMGAQIAHDQDAVGGRWTLLPLFLLMCGILAGLTLFVYGLTRLLGSGLMRPYRFFGWTFVLLTAFVILVNGHPWYLMGLLPVCWAAGAVHAERGAGERWWRWSVSRYAVALTLIGTCVFTPPWQPLTQPPATDTERAAMFIPMAELEWPELTDKVAAAYRALPPAEREQTAILSDSYFGASALEFYGRTRGLPTAYSPDRGYWYFGAPPESAKHVLWLGLPSDKLKAKFAKVTDQGPIGLPMSVLDDNHILLYENRRESWATLWPELNTLG
ncbi:glycosyl transferase [Pseudonocardiaceae bacterium YIM PH 21723]|nr:glycosyl transferase [Pseudonocardiaceae bacterium YIM PH 21723]